MNARFVIPILCVAAVAYACGPRAHNEASTPIKEGTTALASTSLESLVEQQGAPRAKRSPDSALDARLYVRTSESPIRLALHVVNTGKKRVELTFPSGQTHDFVVLDSAGREVWRWGSGRMFTQNLRNKLLAGGASLELEEEIASLPPGRYVVRGVLTSQNYPLTQESELTIPPATVASR